MFVAIDLVRAWNQEPYGFCGAVLLLIVLLRWIWVSLFGSDVEEDSE